MNIRVLIIQNNIPKYRYAIFNKLAIDKDIELTIIHSGSKSYVNNEFSEKIIKNKKIGFLNIQFGLIKWLKRFDVVIGMFDVRWISIIRAQIYCNRNNIPFILWGHGMGESKIFKKLRLLMARKANSLLLYDKKRATPFLHGGIQEEKIFEAPNTLYIENQGINLDTKRKNFIFVGRLYAEKLVDQLIISFSKIESPEDCKLNIVGDGEDKGKLEDLTSKLGISDKVVFHGKINDNNKLKVLFSSSLAYVSPGVVGLGVLHAFAYGIPVVTSEGKYHGPEFNNLNEKNSFIYAKPELDNLAKILKKLLYDPLLSKKMGQNAYSHFKEKRSLESMYKGFKNSIEYAIRE